MERDQALREREADAETAARLLQRPIELRERLEDVAQLLGRDADARVPDREDQLAPRRSGGQLDLAPRGVYLIALFSRLLAT